MYDANLPVHRFQSLISPTGEMTIAQVYEWFEANKLRPINAVSMKECNRVCRLFVERFGNVLACNAKPCFLLTFLAEMKGAKSAWTQRRFKSYIARPFNHAARMGLIACNPFACVRITGGSRRRDWTKEEYQAILRNCSPYMRRFVVFLRFSGARPGEARTLQWAHVDEQARLIVQEEHKTAYVTGAPRRIYFNEVIAKLLAWLKRERARMHRAKVGQKPTAADSHYVFLNSNFERWTIQSLVNHLDIVRRRAGLPKAVKLHGARHTFATNAIVNGVGIATLAQLLGHTSTVTTQKYLHLVNKREHLNAAMQQAIGRGRPAKGSPDVNGQLGDPGRDA